MSDPEAPSNAVLATELKHVGSTVGEVKATVDKILDLLREAPTRAEMREADGQTNERVAAVEGKVEALRAEVQGLKDSNTSMTAVIALAKWGISIGGISLLGVLVRWLMTQG